jgi:zinc finger-containing ubiquitin peptidase 1
MTIVGLEKRADGSMELLVFDPMFHAPASVTRLIGRSRINHDNPDSPLKLYRRGSKYLRKYHEFEILRSVPLQTHR